VSGGSKNVRLLGTLTRNVLVSFVFSAKASILLYFSLYYHLLHLHLAALIHGEKHFCLRTLFFSNATRAKHFYAQVSIDCRRLHGLKTYVPKKLSIVAAIIYIWRAIKIAYYKSILITLFDFKLKIHCSEQIASA